MVIVFKGVNMLMQLCCGMDIGVLFMKSKLKFYRKRNKIAPGTSAAAEQAVQIIIYQKTSSFLFKFAGKVKNYTGKVKNRERNIDSRFFL